MTRWQSWFAAISVSLLTSRSRKWNEKRGVCRRRVINVTMAERNLFPSDTRDFYRQHEISAWNFKEARKNKSGDTCYSEARKFGISTSWQLECFAWNFQQVAGLNSNVRTAWGLGFTLEARFRCFIDEFDFCFWNRDEEELAGELWGLTGELIW